MSAGTLYIVATPIGNLEDITARAISVLQTVDLIAAEDKRHTSKLLKQFDIATPTLAYHDHSDKRMLDKLLTELQAGKHLALVSDAGTPLISDPGYRLVFAARKAGIQVIPIPGACALVAALSIAGLPSDRFVFEGFLPAKQHGRQQRLDVLKQENRTMLFYEAPHRLLACLEDMQKVFGQQRRAVVARELTKLFETVLDGTISELIDRVVSDTNQQKGEFVLLVEGTSAESEDAGQNVLSTLDILLRELPLKQAVALAAEITGHKKNYLYQLALERKSVVP